MFEKAFEIVRVCGLRYVWIDSLCIIQDTVKKEGKDFNEDWESDAAKMGDIYAGGALYVLQADTDSTQWHNGVASERGLEIILNFTDFVSIATLPSFTAASVSAICVPSRTGPPLQPVFQHPSTETPSDDSVDANVKVLLKILTPYFAYNIQGSGLLSRGWVFQEVRLTPANLFCAEDQTWWCCLEVSCAEVYPRPGKAKFAKHFEDLLRDDHLLLTSPEESIVPMERWLILLELYSATSVTEKSDRVVAITGLIERLKELYAQPYQDSMYHSGIWSTEIARQLLWQGDSGPMLPKSRFNSATHRIPTWSPFSYDGKITNPSRKARSQGFLPVKCVKFPQPDHLGRANNTDKGMLHMSGVLVPMDVSTDHPNSGTFGTNMTKAHPRGYADVVMAIHWDSVEDKKKSEAPAPDHRALICVYDPEQMTSGSDHLIEMINRSFPAKLVLASHVIVSQPNGNGQLPAARYPP
ncbi:hypothetical protein INS49_010681 [Diaporthe citri]|uniref:uncharacterized protein n=1 Tax=Diaporthe citri TaxID=83186 RepID=UPI001C7F375D|nr:uncharacterized protein INS49_010681 [Diaporthe citri]KAG6362451.1 hypothetical protein INS49_010681 [Diaporthe citri]